MSVHNNSLIAYWDGEAGAFSRRQTKILDHLRAQNIGHLYTDRELMLALKFSDMNSVRPRITELLQAGALEEDGTAEDPVTRKHVRRVRLKADPRTPQREFSYASLGEITDLMKKELARELAVPRYVLDHRPAPHQLNTRT